MYHDYVTGQDATAEKYVVINPVDHAGIGTPSTINPVFLDAKTHEVLAFATPVKPDNTIPIIGFTLMAAMLYFGYKWVNSKR